MIVGISGYVGNRITGIGRVLVNVLHELALLYPEDQYVLFRNYDFEGYNQLLIHKNIHIVDIKVSKESSIRNILWHQYSFQSLLKKYNCDLAYIPNFSLLLWKSLPTIVSIQDLIEFNVSKKFSKLRMFYRIKIADPLLARNSDYILTVSESSKKDIIKYLDIKESKISVIPNAVDNKMFKKYSENQILDVLTKYDLGIKDYFLFVGTIDYPGKNIKSVLDAFFALKKEYNISEKLVIIGKRGFNSNVIYDCVNQSRYKEDVIFTGYLTDEDLPFFYAGAKIMLYLSLFEGFGLPVLEAMSCGIPIICSNTSCFPEIVRGIDVCVDPTDIDQIKTKLLKFISDGELREQIAKECYEKSKEYSWIKSAKLYYKAFNQLVTSK